MFERVMRTVEVYNMIQKGIGIVLGLSGGADSMALLHCLIRVREELELDIFAVHINHGLRGDASDADELFVRNICEECKVGLTVLSFNLRIEATKMKLTEEEAGRVLRYDCFEKVRIAEKAEVIAVAHNLNDSSETTLFNLFRGCGLAGLSGIAPVRGRIIRPLIECSRAEIEDYCLGNNLCYCTDATNYQNIYTRNKIRLEVMPIVINSINQRAIENIAAASAIAYEENAYLESLAEEAAARCVTYGEKVYICTDTLCDFHPVMQKRILRKAYERAAGSLKDLSARHIGLMQALAVGGTGKKISLPGGVLAEKMYNNLYLYKKEEKIEDFCYNLIYNGFVRAKELGKIFSLSAKPLHERGFFGYALIRTIEIIENRVKNGLVIRSRQPGDIIYFKSVGGHKKIKKFLIDKKLSRSERDGLAYLADGGNIVCILGGKTVLSDEYCAGGGSDSKLFVQMWEENL